MTEHNNVNPAPIVLTPTPGIDPRAALATSVHASPGVYAVLLGSGISSSAGIPTGWVVVQDLVRRLAVADGVPVEDVVERPEDWWKSKGNDEPRYDEVVPLIAPTDAARQSLLASFFEPPTSEHGPLLPTSAHRNVAQLCATGRVRVVITTNFDHLMERALDEIGVTHQVIASTEDIAGMVPLVQSGVTLLKVHGDYTTLGLRNTVAELGEYPAEWAELLTRVFDDFGLISVGWSADYDVALANLVRNMSSRRYPMYWLSYKGELTLAAQKLVAHRSATVIDSNGADAFFEDLARRLAWLDQLAAKRNRSRHLRTYRHNPRSQVESGWATRPTVQLRTAVELSSAVLENCDIIRPRNRDALVERLESIDFEEVTAAWQPQEGASLNLPAPQKWAPPPGGFQSTEHVCYRLGTDASTGVSCLLRVEMPGMAMNSSSVILLLDIGVSVDELIEVSDVAHAHARGLQILIDDVYPVFAELIDADATFNVGEFHLAVNDNDVARHVDLVPFGKAGRDVSSFGHAFTLDGPVTDSAVLDVVCEGLEHVFLGNGYLHPEHGLAEVRARLVSRNEQPI